MKKLLIGLILMICSVGSVGLMGQTTNKDVVINKTTPLLHLNGTYPQIKFGVSGDYSLLQRLPSGQLKLENDTLSTQAYSRLYGGGGDMSYADTATMLSKYARKLNPTFTGTVGGISATMVGLGNVTNESKATMFTNPTFTGTPVIPSPFTLGVTSVTTTGTQLNYLNTATSDIQAQLNDTLDLTTLIPFQADTTTLFAWSVGIGAAGDTANFRKYVPHAYSYGSFFWDGSDTLVITKLIAKVSSGGSLTVQVSWDVNDEDATPTVLNNSSPTITSSTAGDIDTSFDNAEIPPGRWVWLTTPTVTTQPTKLRVTLIGHKRNLTY